jgi:RHS repeat-associated protein
VSVHYEYDPFGTLTRRTGSPSNRFQYRFSTKPRDINTGLYYYGYRWYDPLTGRWLSQDPIGEMGGLNLYGFVENDGVNAWDFLGQRPDHPGCDPKIRNPDGSLDPPGSPPPAHPQKEAENPKEEIDYKCCDDDKIKEGLIKLNELYEKFKEDKTDETPAAGARQWSGFGINGDGSCNTVNTRLINYFQGMGMPKCWKCELVHAHKVSRFFGQDHWWIECRPYDQQGNAKETVQYDWWTGENPGSSPKKNRDTFNIPGDNSLEHGGFPTIHGPSCK